MKKNYLSVLTVGLLLTAFTSVGQQRMIQLKSGNIPVEKMIPVERAVNKDFKDQKVNGKIYVFLQFKNIPTEAEKTRITNAGIQLLSYQPDYAYTASVPARFDLKRLADFNISYIVPIESVYKLSRDLAHENYPQYALKNKNVIQLVVFPYEGISKEKLMNALRSNKIALGDNRVTGNGIAVDVNIEDILSLASIAEVEYVEPIEAPEVPDGIKGVTNHRSNVLSATPGSGFDGSGVVVAVADDGGVSHEDFRGRLTDHNASQGGTHGDMTGGLVSGSGNLDPTKAGMATGSYLHMYHISGYPHVVNAINNFNSLGTVITSTSFSQGCGGKYDATARSLDTDVRAQNVLLHVFSAGNSSSSSCSSVYGSLVASDGRRYGNITGGRKAAKNSIAVANLLYSDARVASSSRGPCEDGRLKPDISATGNSQMSTGPDNTYRGAGGTSAAAPSVAGVSAQLYQAYKSNNSNNNPSSALIKGIMLNTADDIGRPGPDYDHGWGRINGKKAVEVVNNSQHITSTVSQGATKTHSITVPANTKQVKVMVIWLDPQGSTVAAKALVNDLNMTLKTPSNQTYYPWVLSKAAHIDSLQKNAVRGIDNVNNMEQVTLDNPATGTYQVRIAGTSVPTGPQTYHVVYSFVKNEVVMTYPRGGESFVPGESEILHWDAFGNTGNFTLEYSTNDGSSWTTISSTVNGANRYYSWAVPNSVTGKAKIRVSRGGLSHTSGRFNIIGLPGNVAISSNGGASATVSWTAVAGANRYDVYSLGTKYMQVIGSTSGTSLNVNGLSNNNVNWYAVRARHTTNGITGRRSNARKYTHSTNGNSCTDCTASSITAFPYTESFEAGLGSWCQNANDDIDWTRKTGSTTSSNTGPSAASQGSYYMYIEASSPNYPSKNAILESPCFDLSGLGGASMKFAYHMYGATMGTLKLEASTNNGQSWTTLWTLSGNQGNSWKEAMVDLAAYVGGKVTLRFNGTTGTSFTGDMSVDNVRISSVQSSTCTGGITSYPYNQNFDGFSLCGNTSFSCNADGSCSLASGWTNQNGDNIDWSVDNANTPSSSTGPSSDHTSGSGRYLYTEASSCFNKTGHVITPCFDFTSVTSPSMSFWYHMYGNNMGTLSVQASIDNGTTWSGNLWTLSGNQNNSWKQATINLNAYVGKTVKLRFKGTTGSSWQSDMAIDDFRVTANTNNSDQTTTIDDLQNGEQKGATLFPNPAREKLMIETTGLEETATINVYDIVGHQIRNVEAVPSGNGMYEMKVSGLATGTYILQVKSADFTKTIRFNIVK